MIETVVALLMFVNNEIKEHRIQDNMAVCLRGKRTAERQYSENVKYQCVKSKAEIEIYTVSYTHLTLPTNREV